MTFGEAFPLSCWEKKGNFKIQGMSNGIMEDTWIVSSKRFLMKKEIIRTQGITRSCQGLMRAGASPVFAESKGELAAAGRTSYTQVNADLRRCRDVRTRWQ